MTKSSSGGLIQFIKFALVGVANTAVDWVVFYILISSLLSGNHSAAKAVSFAVAVLNSYLLNTVWTFKHEYSQVADKKAAVFTKFVVVSLVGWAVNLYIFNLSASNITFQLINKDLLPLILASGSAIVVNFFGNKLWTYKK